MVLTDPTSSWNDPAGRESSDNAWQAGLRLQQAWWRETVAALPAGQKSQKDDRLVASMLPRGTDVGVNLMTPEAISAYERAEADLVGRPGMIQTDRLERNLLSSQPLCFNAFGYLGAHPSSLLPWVRELDAEASTIERVRIEWAPETGTIGGSAFDAFVEYSTDAGLRGFVGVECKYNEDLAKGSPDSAAEKYREATVPPLWKAGAAEHLDKPKLRQFWYNQLLAQLTIPVGGFDRGVEVVVACDADVSARQATDLVREQLTDASGLQFSSIEHLVSTVAGHDEWKQAFVQRYVDFTPIQSMLQTTDPRRREVLK